LDTAGAVALVEVGAVAFGGIEPVTSGAAADVSAAA
jgi:hypothetical protein